MRHNSRLKIICWAFPSWNGDYMKSTVQLMKELALKHDVIYIDYSYTVKDLIFSSRSFLPVKSILSSRKSLQTFRLDNGGSIRVLSLPPVIPYNWTKNETTFDLIQQVNLSFIKRRIVSVLDAINFNPDVVVNAFNPFFGQATKSIFPDCPVIYYCYDNIEAAQWAKQNGGRLEEDFMRNVEAVVFTSDELRKSKGAKVASYVINNGVDLSLFKNENLIPGKSGIKKKVVGYCGSVDDRLDYDLLDNVICDSPELDFHFIGRVVIREADRLKKFDNVSFLGSRHPKELPQLMSQFDVAIIPFLKNDFTRSIYPMKINEYFILGLPVISTSFTIINEAGECISYADDSDSFKRKIKKSLISDNESLKQRRIGFAMQNSWKQKAVEFESVLYKYAV